MTTRGDNLRTQFEAIRTAALTLAANADALQFQAGEPAADASTYQVKVVPNAIVAAAQAERLASAPFSGPTSSQEAWIATSGSSVFIVARIK